MQLRAALAGALFAMLLPGTAIAAGTTLRLTLQQPLSDPAGQNIATFKSEAETGAGGGISIKLFDSGQLYPDYQVPAAVGGGTIEMGVTPLVHYAQLIPIAGIFMQPFLFNFTSIVRAASKNQGTIRRLIDGAILSETGARVLWWQPNGWNVIFSKQNAVNPKAISGQNIRVFDDVSAEFVTLCGGNPQLIAESKQSEALDLNLVSATMTSVASLKSYELWKRTRHLSDIRHSANILIVVINDDVWQKLTEKEKAALTTAAEAAEERSWQEFQKTEEEIYGFARSKAMTVEEPLPDDLVEWRVCSSSILESFMARSGGAGHELLSAYGKLRADPCCSQGSGVTSPR